MRIWKQLNLRLIRSHFARIRIHDRPRQKTYAQMRLRKDACARTAVHFLRGALETRWPWCCSSSLAASSAELTAFLFEIGDGAVVVMKYGLS